MTQDQVRVRLEAAEGSLSPYAMTTALSKGRDIPEPPSSLRTEFQRDRDRITHTKTFRRLKHKTQVFIAPQGDHFATRLTHTLEVAQIGRTIARALNLNEDLEEAICLGHDLGHTPFGHVGEETMGDLVSGGFRHNRHSLRVVEVLEKGGKGLNLTWEVRHGIVNHSKPRGDFLGKGVAEDLSLEAQICRISDAVAYLNHDLADAIRAGLLSEDDLPETVKHIVGTRHAQRIDTMVTDIVEASWKCTGEDVAKKGRPTVRMSPRVRSGLNLLREFLFENIYLPESRSEESQRAREVITFLYHYFVEHYRDIPEEYWVREESHEQMAVDYISGMTDRYALRLAERLSPGISQGTFAGRV
jgi:dGTPase